MNRNIVLVMLLGCTPSHAPRPKGPLLCAEGFDAVGGSVDRRHRINGVEVRLWDPTYYDLKNCGRSLEFVCVEMDDAPAKCELTIEP